MNFAGRGFRPFYYGNIVRGWISLIGRLILITYFHFGLFEKNYLNTAIAYVGLHAVFYVVGKLLHNAHQKRLRKIETEYTPIHTQYICDQLSRHGISDGNMQYGNATIASGTVAVTMNKGCKKLEIFQTEIPEDDLEFYNRSRNLLPDEVVLNSKIASVQFNKKFGVITDKGQEIDAFNFLSPSLQINLIKTNGLKKFSNIRIMQNFFLAKTTHTVDAPNSVINAFSKKSFLKCFEEIDKYCHDMRKMGDTVSEELQKLGDIIENDQAE